MTTTINLATVAATTIPAILTTDHAASSYGIPVLVIDNVAYGAGDSLPGTRQVVAYHSVAEAINLGARNSRGERCERISFGLDADQLIDRFLSTYSRPVDTTPILSQAEQDAFFDIFGDK